MLPERSNMTNISTGALQLPPLDPLDPLLPLLPLDEPGGKMPLDPLVPPLEPDDPPLLPKPLSSADDPHASERSIAPPVRTIPASGRL